MTTLAHLETFVEVASLGSFAAAARQLDLPRSTVTARIKALEEELGVALFQRTTRQVRLTVEGEAYREKVQPALRDLEEAGEQLKSAQAPQGMVRMSVPVDLPLDVLAEAMASFNLRYPEVRVEVHVSDRPVDLTGERFDFALRGNRVASESVIVRKIASSFLVLVARPELLEETVYDHLLKSGRVIDPAEVLEEAGQGGGVPVYRTRNLQLALALVLNGGVAGILPKSMCAEFLADGRLAEAACPVDLPELPLFAVLPSRRFIPKRVRLLVDHLASAFG
ncbi:LysR family transcriptional regulator [Roseibium aggregatum]|uniref:LysR family transcriptional regulator n=1 Tax=Roseibium aggregatum TaxID=187304 RepID=UPI001E29370B|nr:LysR family transcriptional regulator [Roseibium aggregatum]UES54729.1 LysR family transcriptional regulator [Roseibium aggregatum]